MQKNEPQARIKINKLLEKSGWRFSDNKQGKANIELERNIKIKTKDIERLGNDFENTKNGFIDYLLLDHRSFPLCVLEAKKESIHPLSAKEQARTYAKGKNCRFVILSNGISHYFWDLTTNEPQQITNFPTQKSLQHRLDYQKNIIDLSDEKVDETYLAPKKTLRTYQVQAIHALQQSAKEGKERFLFEMATGTGKTTIAAAICKLFLTTGNAKRILFLVDRIELEGQAVTAFQNIFENQYFINTVKSKQWNPCQIVVSTIQTLLTGNRYRELFSAIDFELVISDEAHRSLSGDFRAVFEYFLGFKLGLTATPKNYLKDVDEHDLAQKNIKALEARNLKDTYKTFDCNDGNPTYRYDLNQGIKDEYLIKPYVIDVRTEITTEMLSKDGFKVLVEDDERKHEEQIFKKDFERKVFNEATNHAFCQSILEKGLKDPFTGEFGKTLVFCVSQKHAAKITQILNNMASQKWQGQYQSDFAVQVTSQVLNSGTFTKDFSDNKLRGKSKFNHEKFPDYETSKTRICVTVNMMTVGYDCPDLLNVVLMRPIYSPYDFIQMKGRGTRKYTFKYHETREEKQKMQFLLLDFFANCEYFENDFDYNEKIPLNIEPSQEDLFTPEKKSKLDTIDINKDDHIKTETIIYIGKKGMKIDNALYPEIYQQFEQVLQNPTLQDINQNQGIEVLEEFIKTEIFNKPTEYWTAQKIRESYEKQFQINRKISLAEMILKALGLQKFFKTREERLEEEYQKFIDIEKPKFDDETSKTTKNLKSFFEHYLSDKKFREIIEKKEFAELDGYPSFTIDELAQVGKSYLQASSYVKKYLQQEMGEFEFKKN